MDVAVHRGFTDRKLRSLTGSRLLKFVGRSSHVKRSEKVRRFRAWSSAFKFFAPTAGPILDPCVGYSVARP